MHFSPGDREKFPASTFPAMRPCEPAHDRRVWNCPLLLVAHSLPETNPKSPSLERRQAPSPHRKEQARSRPARLYAYSPPKDRSTRQCMSVLELPHALSLPDALRAIAAGCERACGSSKTDIHCRVERSLG